MASAAQIRQAAVDLSTLAAAEIASLKMSPDPYKTKDLLIRVLPLIGDHYGLAAAALAADWYDDMRAEKRVQGRFRAVPHLMPDENRFIKLVEWGISPLFGEEPDYMTTISKITGGMQRIVMDQQRLTIVDNTQLDPKAKGWKRVGSGHNCEFCQMLISRGGVYTGKSVAFRSHDACNCSAAPSWDPNARLVTDEPYQQSKRKRSDATKAADNKRARNYMKDL